MIYQLIDHPPQQFVVNQSSAKYQLPQKHPKKGDVSYAVAKAIKQTWILLIIGIKASMPVLFAHLEI